MGSTFFIVDLLAYFLKPLHHQFFSCPRSKILGSALSKFLPACQDLTGLDVGCGPGTIAKEIRELRPRISFAGVDVIQRLQSETSHLIDFQTYDGHRLPYADKTYSFSMLIDVLHHTDSPKQLLAEASRVAQDFILIKDHISDSQLDKLVLSLMDWVGNKSYGVHLPYNYLASRQWQSLFSDLNLTVEGKLEDLALYTGPLNYVFGRKLHFIAKLKIKR